MNENLPPANTPPTFIVPPPPPKPPNFWLMFAIGIGVLIASWGLCFLAQQPTPALLGFIGAIVTLFFKGYRGIFIGYIASIGLGLLILAIMCGMGGNNMEIGR